MEVLTSTRSNPIWPSDPIPGLRNVKSGGALGSMASALLELKIDESEFNVLELGNTPETEETAESWPEEVVWQPLSKSGARIKDTSIPIRRDRPRKDSHGKARD